LIVFIIVCIFANEKQILKWNIHTISHQTIASSKDYFIPISVKAEALLLLSFISFFFLGAFIVF
jgi:hypothetical protein